MALTFLQLQDSLIGDRFRNDKRPLVKEALNSCYSAVWNHGDWTFRKGTDAVTVTANSRALTGVASDVGSVVTLQNSDGDELEEMRDLAEFYYYYPNSDTSTGQPEAFVVANGSVLVGPTSSVTSSAYFLVYQKALTAMIAETDEPALPDEFHIMLVFGARRDMEALDNDPNWQVSARLFDQKMADLETGYLSESKVPQVWGGHSECS